MSGYYETIPLDDTAIFKWTRQDLRPYTETIAGDIVIAAWGVYGVEITGEYTLANEAETLARLTQFAEIVENHADTFGFWGEIWRPSAYIRHTVVGAFWVNPDPHPVIRMYMGENRAYVEFFMRYIGDTASHQTCYLVDGLTVISSDWSI